VQRRCGQRTNAVAREKEHERDQEKEQRRAKRRRASRLDAHCVTDRNAETVDGARKHVVAGFRESAQCAPFACCRTIDPHQSHAVGALHDSTSFLHDRKLF
jgi:hypothetical protein